MHPTMSQFVPLGLPKIELSQPKNQGLVVALQKNLVLI
jgi:hypothetical protein